MRTQESKAKYMCIAYWHMIADKIEDPPIRKANQIDHEPSTGIKDKDCFGLVLTTAPSLLLPACLGYQKPAMESFPTLLRSKLLLALATSVMYVSRLFVLLGHALAIKTCWEGGLPANQKAGCVLMAPITPPRGHMNNHVVKQAARADKRDVTTAQAKNNRK